MASPHIEARPMTLPLITPSSPFDKPSSQTSTKSPTPTPTPTSPANTTSPPTPRTPNPQPHIKSMLDVGPDTTPRKTNTPQQQNGAGRPTSTVATSNDVTSTEVPLTTPNDISPPQSLPAPVKARPKSASNLASMTTAAMSADTPRSIGEATSPAKLPPNQRRASWRKETPESKNNTTPTASPPSPTKEQKPKFGRVRSFLRRSNSNSKNDVIAPTTQLNGPEAPLQSRDTASTTKSNVFSFSSRSSATSRSTTPPSPGSPASTINEAASESGLPEENVLTQYHTHSQSYSNLANGVPRAGITWGPGVGKERPESRRRRSVSTEHIGTLKKRGAMAGIREEQEPRLNLLTAFSQEADEGVGMKARRLSTCLPDEFWVDYGELDREFVSQSKNPLTFKGKLLGNGATSVVRLYRRKDDRKGSSYAVKEFRLKDDKEKEEDYVKKVKSEYSIAKSLHHPNIVETVRLCKKGGRWNHVMEYCVYGELFTMVEKGFFKPDGPFKLSDRQCLFKQLIRGVDYLHSHGIAHRDIKLENLLMTAEGYLKITDFGVSEVFSGEHPGLRASGGECGKNMKDVRKCAPGLCGSLPYIAPEVIEKKGDYDPRPLDVWSCAMVYIHMTYGGSPWTQAAPGQPQYDTFLNGWNKFLDKHPDGLLIDGPGGVPACGPIFNAERFGSPAMKRLILKMLHPIPEKRITIHEVLVGPTVRSIECCSPESYENSTCCVDAKSGKKKNADGKVATKKVLHNHVPPKKHLMPGVLQHRFDMGDGYS